MSGPPQGQAPALTARRASAFLLGASLAMLALLAYAGTWLTFWSDEWSFLFRRADPSVRSLLRGSDVHLHLFPWLIYQALYRLVGLGSYYPYLAVAWTFHLACVWLLFSVTGRLAGWGFALVAGLSLLFLGSGFEVLLQPGQMGYTLAEAMGLLAIRLLLDRPAPWGLLCTIAGLALVVGVASSGVGMIFVGLIGVWALLRRDGAGLAAACPAFVLYAVWFPIGSVRTTARLAWTPEALLDVLASVGHGIGATVNAVLGLARYEVALAGLLIAAAVLAIALWRGARLDALAIAALAALIAEFVLVAGFRPRFGIGWTARSGYLHPAAAFLWLGAAAMCANGAFRRRAWLRPWLVAPILILAIAGNLAQFAGAARSMRVQRAGLIVYLRLIEGLRDSPDLDRDGRAMYRIAPANYLRAIDRFGIPRLASREPTLAEPGRASRASLDAALARLVGPGIRPAPEARAGGAAPVVAVTGGRAEAAGGSCARVAAGEGGAAATWTPATGVFSARGEPPGALRALRLGVFDRPAQALDSEIVGEPGVPVRLPALPPPLQWSVEVEVAAGQAVTVCSARAG